MSVRNTARRRAWQNGRRRWDTGGVVSERSAPRALRTRKSARLALGLCLVLLSVGASGPSSDALPPPEPLPSAPGAPFSDPIPLSGGASFQLASALYDSSGLVQTFCPSLEDASAACITDMVFDWAGRTVVGGWAIVDGKFQFMLIRFRQSGLGLDTDFGEGGITFTDFTEGVGALAFTMAIDNNNSIVVGGGMYRSQSSSPIRLLRLALSRYRAGGKLDTYLDLLRPGFAGGDGMEVTNVQGVPHECITDLVIDDQNRIVVAGGAIIDGHFQVLVARYTPAGELDETFGEGGIVLHDDTRTQDEAAVAVAINDESVIVVASQAGEIDGVRKLLLRWYDPSSGDELHDALLDSWENPDLSFRVNDMAIHGDDIFVVGGRDNLADGRTRILVQKVDSSGSLDAGFGNNGTVKINLGSTVDAEGIALSISKETGNIAVAGHTHANSDAELGESLVVAKLKPNGDPVTTFGSNGVAQTDIEGAADGRPNAAIIYEYQDVEYILVAGVCGDWSQ